MILEIVKYGNPVLRQKGTKIESITPEIKKLIADMFETMEANHGVGLAAQQIGRALQLTVIFANYRDTTSAAAEYAMKQWQELGAKVELRGSDNNFIISNTFAAKDLTSWSISIGLTVQSDTPSIFVPYFAGPTPPSGVNFASIDCSMTPSSSPSTYDGRTSQTTVRRHGPLCSHTRRPEWTSSGTPYSSMKR